MRFSNMVDYKQEAHFVVKTGRKNIRILKPGEPYEKSFVVPIKKIANRRPADGVEPDEDEDDGLPEDLSELTDPNEEAEQDESEDTQDVPEDEFQPQ